MILNTPSLEVENRKVMVEALLLYGIKRIDFIDAYNLAYMKHIKVLEVYSYDKDFDEVEFSKRVEP